MRHTFLALLATFLLSLSAFAQSSERAPTQPQTAAQTAPTANVPAARPEDVKSIDTILTALYGVISGPAGERDWNRFRSLFLPPARLTAATKNADGSSRVRPMGVADYIKGAGS